MFGGVTESVFETVNRNGVANMGSNPIIPSYYGSVAQSDRAFDYESKGCEFESHQNLKKLHLNLFI